MTNIVDASLYQNQKYVSLDGHVFSWHAYLIADDFYQGLNQGEQNAINQCFEIAKVIHRGMTAAQDANASAILSEKGMTVVPVSPENKEKFVRQHSLPFANSSRAKSARNGQLFSMQLLKNIDPNTNNEQVEIAS